MNAWWILALAFAVTAAALLLVASLVIGHIRHEATQIVRERFICPLLKRDVTATFVRDGNGEFTEVRSCSAFLFPDEVTCNALCIEHLNESLTLPERGPVEQRG